MSYTSPREGKVGVQELKPSWIEFHLLSSTNTGVECSMHAPKWKAQDNLDIVCFTEWNSSSLLLKIGQYNCVMIWQKCDCTYC
uniref:Uncharacterized protein n=1 Tax=Physcomitrium patens TaxID=3218 RepID=A0A2K1JIT9_PHYPA|nr:hypothetical protein PHYPA_018868 [Physcomitrium patens]